jgi:glycine/D-amino acid oxidase-like deaminating enzyme/nitrite reductase/ring-hydroxylating ferredoxin subunit
MISRDGARTSLWQNTVNEYTPAVTAPTRKYDVAIAGGGITGITLALQLQQHGLRCIVLEAQNLGFGTTGGTTAHLNTLLDTPYTQIIKDFGLEAARNVTSAVRAAIQLIKDNIDNFAIDCDFAEVPAYLFAQTDDQRKELENIQKACAEVGVDARFISSIPLPVSFNSALQIEGQAKFHPLRYLNALAAAFEKLGGVILQNCRVTNCEKAPQYEALLNIHTSQGVFHADNMVYATHIPPGVNIIHFRCPAYRSYAMAVTLEDEAYPYGLIYDMYDPYHYYRTQSIDGRNYLIVGGEDHKTGEEPNTAGCLLKLEAHVRSHFRVAEVTHQWSSQYFQPVDGLPYIGHLPGAEKNVYVATGYGGNGMTYSHVAALVLRSLIMGYEDPYAEIFKPSRLKPFAGFTEFVKHNADVVKQFVGKWFDHAELQAFAGLAPGEGQVVKYKGETIALYKDEAGTLHAVNPTCTHAKCSVEWNGTEKSWDCPCHGSRFSCDGEMLTAPADKNLETISLRTLQTEVKETSGIGKS